MPSFCKSHSHAKFTLLRVDCRLSSLSAAETMTDYNMYLGGLMADCQRSVQRPSHPPEHPTIPTQHFATPSTPLPSYSFEEPQTIAPRPCIFRNLPSTAADPAAYTSRNIPPAGTAFRPYVSKHLTLPAAGPRPYATKDRPPAADTDHPNVNKNVPPAATASRSAISRNPLPVPTAPSPFVPLFQLPIVNSISACAPQKIHEPTTPIGQAAPRQDTRKGCSKEEPIKVFPIRYKNLTQSAMREELRARGLLCHGKNSDLVERLEKDDEFQAKPRTAENYDTLSPEDTCSLCVRRCIPSQGLVSSLKDRLKAHDKRRNETDAAVPGLSPSIVSRELLSALEVKVSQEMPEEKQLVQKAKNELASVTETAEKIDHTAETVALTKPMKRVEHKPINDMLLGQNIHKACNDCHNRHVSSIPTIQLGLADLCHSVVVYMT